MISNTDVELLRCAYRLAAETCPDPSTQIGALLVDGYGHVRCRGVNSFPKGIAVTPERLADREVKRRLVCHAEQKVIFEAARKGVRTSDLTLICTWAACPQCATAIIEAGIRRVVTHDIPAYKTHPAWAKSVEEGMAALGEAGVQIDKLKNYLGGGLRVRLNLQEIEV